jgi:uncharacterized protein DUF1573
MRKALLALVATAMAAGPVCAQEEWANKLFEERSKDFGTHPRGVQLKHSFKLTNIYKVPLDLTNIRVTCGCVTYTTSKKSLMPNETATLDINMDTTKWPGGHKLINIYVTVGPQFVSTATLTVQAVSRQDVTFNPGTVNFGVVGKGQTPTQTIDVEYAGNLPWRINEIVKNASAPFTVKAEELYREDPKPGGLLKKAQAGRVGYRLTLALKADTPTGPFKQELLLKTNDGDTPVLTVVAEGKIQATLTVNPSKVNLGTLKVGDTKSAKVFVVGQRAFRITGVEGHGDGLKVELPGEAKESQVLTFSFEAKAAGNIRRQVRIRSDQDNETVVVTIEANVVGPEGRASKK